MTIKKISKFTFVLLLATMFVFSGICASAISMTYNLSDIGVSITLPENVNTITKDTKSSDDIFQSIMSYEEAEEYFKDNNAYLLATAFDFSYTIELQMTKPIATDIETLKSTIEQSNVNQDVTTKETPYSTYCTYSTVETDELGIANYCLFATTLQNKEQYTVKLISNQVLPTDDEIAYFNNTIDTLSYSEPVIATAPLNKSNPSDTPQTPQPSTHFALDVASIAFNVLMSILALAVIFGIIIYYKTKKDNAINGNHSDHNKATTQNYMDDFYDELNEVENSTAQKSSTQNSYNSTRKRPVRGVSLEIEVPIEKIRVTKESQVVKRKLDEEKDSVEITHSDNEDFNEYVSDDVTNNSKTNSIFKRKNKNNNSSESTIDYKPKKEISKEVVTQDVIVKEFEQDDYWNKYK